MANRNLLDCLSYDALTGVFVWTISPRGNVKNGAVAGTLTNKGYRMIKINSKFIMAHRMAWFFHYGFWPELQVDHINGIRDDNRIENLRLANNSENQQNQKKAHVTNKCGFLGVHKKQTKWAAQIRVNGKKKHIGYFDSAEEAHKAYVKQKNIHHSRCTLEEAV